jgi:outer membrane lipoprotein-sorting protein
MVSRSLSALVGILGAAISASGATNLTAREILDRVDDLHRGDSAHGTFTMHIVTTHWSRSLGVTFHSRGKDRSLHRVLTPPKERGVATLRIGPEMWQYLPKVNRVIKLPSSMMGASWMGSHVTNDDLVKESRFADDYDFTITFQGQRQGTNIIEIVCVPKPGAAVVWGKAVVTVSAADYLPRRLDYYDEAERLVRVITFSREMDVGGRTVLSKVSVRPLDKPGERTDVEYTELTFDVDVPDDWFSLRNLQR